MNKITPFLSFDGKAEEAAQFYVSLMPDSQIDRVTRSLMDTPGGPAGSVLLVEFTLAGSPFMALNTPGFTFTEGVSLLIPTSNQIETDRVWAALTSNGGQEMGCGWCKDRWGVVWQVCPAGMIDLLNDPDRDRARRAMEAMVNMIKIDINEVRRAADAV
ncbi:MAG: hypothetical protein JWO08_3388 [Verrucomicrobiaceae bacterium]|nr:hypothetical protein [Verrucomicrobiaceae bacterium]